MRIGLITSAGGHLFQLYQLRKAWKDMPHFWVSFDKSDVRSLLKKEKIYFAHFPESRNLPNFIKNLFSAIKILKKERPQVLISTGAAIAIPFYLVGKITGLTLVYIEPADFIAQPSLTGRLAYPLVDLFLIQNKKQKRFFPEAKYWGSSL